jgi:hypothetical protein
VWRAVTDSGDRLELRWQQRFSTSADGAFTLSAERLPDFVLLRFRDGHLICWLILDAKYRVRKQAIHDALADMHVYRDALRWTCAARDITLPAAGGYLLVPAIHTETQRYGAATYHETWHFGICAIDDLPIKEFLRALNLEGAVSPPSSPGDLSKERLAS